MRPDCSRGAVRAGAWCAGPCSLSVKESRAGTAEHWHIRGRPRHTVLGIPTAGSVVMLSGGNSPVPRVMLALDRCHILPALQSRLFTHGMWNQPAGPPACPLTAHRGPSVAICLVPLPSLTSSFVLPWTEARGAGSPAGGALSAVGAPGHPRVPGRPRCTQRAYCMAVPRPGPRGFWRRQAVLLL